MFQIQDMFENGKPDIVLKTVKRYNLKIITALRNQNIDIICSYNIDLTRKAGSCRFKMLENKSIFSTLTDKMWKM